MRAAQLEADVLRILDIVAAGNKVEDARYELKLILPDANSDTARRVAAHANAMAGEHIIWIVGADDKAATIKTPPPFDLADWIPAFSKHFDGIAPDLLRDLRIPCGDETVTALVFETERAPYVVKNPAGGKIGREVPFRMGTRVESATREQLLRILVPKMRLPEARWDRAILAEWVDEDKETTWELVLFAYVVPSGDERVVIPLDGCRAAMSWIDRKHRLRASFLEPVAGDDVNIGVRSPPIQTATALGDGEQLILTGPAHIVFQAKARTVSNLAGASVPMQVAVSMRPAASRVPLSFTASLSPVPHWGHGAVSRREWEGEQDEGDTEDQQFAEPAR